MTKEIRVFGIVQGVGFRPTVSRHASASGIKGTVSNKGPYVEIIAQGTETEINTFLDLLKTNPPKRSSILKIIVNDYKDTSFESFEIIESEKTKGEIYISPDIALCDECKEELYTKGNRRYLHPFINCTNCGPRLTILKSLPYDRVRTTMSTFEMCDDCKKEYYDPHTRRYDAQPIACNKCGPEVRVLDTDIKNREAIIYVRQALSDGLIVAIKGIGGFHLACDATNEEAVARLRRLKHRPSKPFALMMKDESVVERECEVECRDILTGHQKPILLLKRKKSGLVAQNVAYAPSLGVMLPYAPLQCLLFDYDDGLHTPDVLVMTSANESGEPMVSNDEEARYYLKDLCDVVLTNNRDILTRCDDTVMDIFEGQPYMIRRSRGYAPLPVMVSGEETGHILGIGGELKNTFCIGKNTLFYPSSYIGDLENLRTGEVLKETIERMSQLLEVQFDLIVCDLHPRYMSTDIAKSFGLPLIPIQHHYAHILSCMAENDYHEKVLGVSFDGTGYGDDGTIWGGEIFVCDKESYERKSHIQPFVHIGGDIASKEGWRIAVSMIHSLYDDNTVALDLDLCDQTNLNVQKIMYEKHLNSIVSTSAGRLFDAVSAILGINKISSYESEAAQQLQYLSENGTGTIQYRYDVEENLPTDKLVKDIIRDKIKNEPIEEIGYAFHDGLAYMIVEKLKQLRKETGINTVALSGGVFQNTLLLGCTKYYLEKENFTILIHHLIPPNDGGIALGQAFYGMHYKQKGV